VKKKMMGNFLGMMKLWSKTLTDLTKRSDDQRTCDALSCSGHQPQYHSGLEAVFTKRWPIRLVQFWQMLKHGVFGGVERVNGTWSFDCIRAFQFIVNTKYLSW
jgi:hypothetical protein